MKRFLKVTLSKTFSKHFLIFVFGFVCFELITRGITKLIHHNADSIHLLIVPSLLIIVIMYIIKYIVECFKYFHNHDHEGEDVSAQEHRTNVNIGLNFLAFFCLILTFLFLNSNQVWLFLLACLIAVVLRIILLVKDH